MLKVITYGTYDLLHYGHIRLLERAKALGDYLIVGVTADDFDKTRGKINVQQSLMERIEAVRATGLADKIIAEEYEGQKIDDIRRYDIDIFAIGSDWLGKFEYLNNYCKVIYLERTKGISSSTLRDQRSAIKFGLMGDSLFLNKVLREASFVNGIHVNCLCTNRPMTMDIKLQNDQLITDEYDMLLDNVDAVYIRSLPKDHYKHIEKALNKGKHVLCESPLSLSLEQSKKLMLLANTNRLVLMEAIKTAYCTAYTRLLLLLKGGKIGNIITVDATCTSLKVHEGTERTDWDGLYEWGPTALLPVFQILGTEYKECKIISHFWDDKQEKTAFTKIDFLYNSAVASIKVGDGIKAEGELIVSGTKGYIYVPAPWWKTDYFEIRYENPAENKRYFYQLDGEGIRYELVSFRRAIESGLTNTNIEKEVSLKISDVMNDFACKNKIIVI